VNSCLKSLDDLTHNITVVQADDDSRTLGQKIVAPGYSARKQSFRLVTIAIPDTKLVAMVKQSMTDSSSQQAGTDDANLIVFNFQGSGSILS
jgi:hypothetical protein